MHSLEKILHAFGASKEINFAKTSKRLAKSLNALNKVKFVFKRFFPESCNEVGFCREHSSMGFPCRVLFAAYREGMSS